MSAPAVLLGLRATVGLQRLVQFFCTSLPVYDLAAPDRYSETIL